jgi:ABC-2 type transport system permease protein
MLILTMAYMISFTFKMIIGIIALWTTDTRGLQQLVDVIIILFAGYIVPVNLLPGILEKIAYFSPFPYMVYFPVIAVQGKLSFYSLFSVIGIQAIWLIVLVLAFLKIWRRGLKRFTDLGH